LLRIARSGMVDERSRMDICENDNKTQTLADGNKMNSSVTDRSESRPNVVKR